MQIVSYPSKEGEEKGRKMNPELFKLEKEMLRGQEMGWAQQSSKYGILLQTRTVAICVSGGYDSKRIKLWQGRPWLHM